MTLPSAKTTCYHRLNREVQTLNLINWSFVIKESQSDNSSYGKISTACCEVVTVSDNSTCLSIAIPMLRMPNFVDECLDVFDLKLFCGVNLHATKPM